MLSDFFKKDVTAYPSGDKSLGDKSRCGAYDRALAKAGMFVCSVAMAASLTGCGPSQAKIDAMKDKVPEKQKKELIAKCDSALLANIEECYQLGGGAKPESHTYAVGVAIPLTSENGDALSNAVLNGYKAARAEVLDTLPERGQRTGIHYVVLDYMNACSAQAVRTQTDYEPCWTTEGIKMKLTEKKFGRPEFYQSVAQRVADRQAQQAAVKAKALQNGR
ncbi:MAG TPA: hypothetical protein DD624_01405 [Alphaproteobacteria bacterium]|nr:hypothetical protein [Alphaproteobacteria bacterium]